MGPRELKWWETEDGREVDRLWEQAIGDLKDPARRHEIPEYALDRHTRRGWEVKAEQGWFDDRFSGTDLGRIKTSHMFVRDGLIDARSRVEYDRDGVADESFWQVWRDRKRLQGEDYSPPPDHEPEKVSLFDEGEEGMTVFAYLRVSTMEQADSGAGLAAQRDPIVRESISRGWEDVEFIEDGGYSGGTLDRPGIASLLPRLRRVTRWSSRNSIGCHGPSLMRSDCWSGPRSEVGRLWL